MSRQTEILALNNNLDTKDYRFNIIHNGARRDLRYAPDGWDDEIIFERNEKYKGVFRKYADNEIKFVKDGRERIKEIYEADGINADARLIVYKQNQSTFTQEIHYEGKIDFSTYKIDEIYASVQVMDDSLPERVKNMENVDVDLFSEESITGKVLDPIRQELKVFDFKETSIFSQANYADEEYTMSDTAITPTTFYDQIQATIGFADIEEAETQTKQTVDYFYRTAPSNVTLKLTGTMSGRVRVMNNVGSYDFAIYVRDDTNSTWGILKSYTSISESGWYNFSFSDEEIDWAALASGRSLALQMRISVNNWTAPSTGAYDLEVTSSTFFLQEEIFNIPEETTSCFQYYEAFYQILRKLTDRDNPFYSEYFGRIDSAGTVYASDGQLGCITKGQMIRGLDNKIDVNFAVSLEDLFNALNAIFNIGLGFEQVGGVDKIRVEGYDYFFDDNVVLDVSSRISIKEVGKEVLPKWHYSQVKVGYSKFENEVDGALFEFNGKHGYSTVLQALSSMDNTLDIVCKFRADSNGINVLRNEFGTENSEDVDGDDDTFVVDLIRDGVEFIARTNDDFLVVSGAPTDSNNLLYTPKRNLRRHGSTIRAGLERNLNTPVKFQISERLTNLITQLTTESLPLIDISDTVVGFLDEPRWWAEAYTVDECPLYSEDIRDLEANPRGLIKLADDMYGWIMEIKTSKNNKASLKLLRANLNYITPV